MTSEHVYVLLHSSTWGDETFVVSVHRTLEHAKAAAGDGGEWSGSNGETWNRQRTTSTGAPSGWNMIERWDVEGPPSTTGGTE